MKNLLIITGPTASGKSQICLKIAEKKNGVIINCDSKQIYKEIPIITSQPICNQFVIPHKLYGYISVRQNYSVALWQNDLKQSVLTAWNNSQLPIITGGSGLYIYSIIYGLSKIPEIKQSVRMQARNLLQTLGNEEFYKLLVEKDYLIKSTIHPNNSYQLLRAFELITQTGISISVWKRKKREPIFDKVTLCIITPPRELVYQKINQRFIEMINSGVVEEVKNLLPFKLSNDLPAMKSHGVPEIIQYLENKITLNEAIEQAQKNTRHYAKRQYTWFSHQFPQAQFFNDHSKLTEYILDNKYHSIY